MAFFDELGKKISNAGQTAMQKTQEMAAVARLNSSISEEEKRINNTYYQIGKLYVSKHISDFEDDFAGMIFAIKESESKIVDYRQQVQNIKGVVRCEKCGAEVANNVAFCSSCGAPMPRPTQAPTTNANLIKCSGCGAMVDKSMRFCTSCGKPIADITKSISEANQADNQVDVKPAANKCPNCGEDIAEGLAFCTECGTKLN